MVLCVFYIDLFGCEEPYSCLQESPEIWNWSGCHSHGEARTDWSCVWEVSGVREEERRTF